MKAKDFFIDASPLTKLGLTAFFSVSSFLILLVISIVIAIPLFGIDIARFDQELSLSSTSNTNIIKYFQISQAISLFILPAIVAGYLLYGTSRNPNGLGLHFKPLFVSILLAALAMITALPIINVLALVNQNIQFPEFLKGVELWMQDKEAYARELTDFFLAVDNVNDLLINVLMIGVLPALGEEFLFRGIIQRIFSDMTKNIHVAIIITSILFSALHFQFYGFFPRVLMGLFFGYLMFWTGNIWIPVAAHFTNNTFAVVVYYVYNTGKTDVNVDELGLTPETTYAFFVSLFVTSMLIMAIYIRENKSRKSLPSVVS